MPPIALAFFWHQHQPYYPDDVGRREPHALGPAARRPRTTSGMALHLPGGAGVPLHASTSSPACWCRFSGYTERRRATGTCDVSRLPADGSGGGRRPVPARQFFMANPEHDDPPLSALSRAVLSAAGLAQDPAAARPCGGSPSATSATCRCWSNLTWIHPLAFEHDADLRAFRQEGPRLDRRRRSTGCSTSRWRSCARSFRCTGSWRRAARSS